LDKDTNNSRSCKISGFEFQNRFGENANSITQPCPRATKIRLPNVYTMRSGKNGETGLYGFVNYDVFYIFAI
jgi:hypothetical protein